MGNLHDIHMCLTNGDEDEDAINYGASSFILSGFNSPVKSHLSTPLPVRQDIARSMFYLRMNWCDIRKKLTITK
jgi:hypothetical protein